MADIALGEREAEVMKALWALGSGTVAEVRTHLAAGLAYTTVLTILRNLQEKGLVEPVVEGRAHRYIPLVSEAEVRSSALGRLVRSLFRGSPDELVAHPQRTEHQVDARHPATLVLIEDLAFMSWLLSDELGDRLRS